MARAHCAHLSGQGGRLLPLTQPAFQDAPYLDDLSNASLFSSSVDSLSDIVDTPDFPHADSLSQVPTIWDVSTGPSTHDKVSKPRGLHAMAVPGPRPQPLTRSWAGLLTSPLGPRKCRAWVGGPL